ncbi:MAG: hypothetical protein PQJ60_04180 [Spirochaetales bacterium]|nr:hypothetical protein [Spirochaetales bacterium]
MDQKAIFMAIQDRFMELQANVFLNLIVLLILLILILVFLVLYRRNIRSKSVKEWRTEYNRLVREFDLTINELDLLNRMVVFLDDRARINLLLTNRNTYHHVLKLLEKKEEGIPRYSESLTEKLYGQGVAEMPEGFETLFGFGRPVRLISALGRVYTGHIITRESKRIVLGNVHLLQENLKNSDVRDMGRLFIQDYRGLTSHGVSEIHELSETSFELILSSDEPTRKNGFRLPDIYIFLPGEKEPVKTHFYRVSEGMGLVENPGGLLKMDQTVKVALQKDTNHHYHVNGVVRAMTLNKRYARLKFGYLNEKFY